MQALSRGAVLLWALCVGCSSDADSPAGGQDAGAGGGNPDAGTGGGDPAGGAGGGGGGGDGGSAGSAGDAGSPGVDEMLADLEATGIFDNLDRFTPDTEETTDNVTKHWFAVSPDGPQCIDSSPFGLATRDQGSNNLVIFLMGGGACWSGFPFCTTTVGGQINGLDNGGGPGIMSPADDGPTASWNHVFVPYCDGSVFIGDRTADIIPEGEDATFAGDEVLHGLKNLSAALDVSKANFPNPDRILLAGSSAGGFGTIWATGLVRKLYPDAELLVLNDAGVGIARPSEPEFQDFLQSEWGAQDRFPASCAECADSAHVTPLISWGLARDPELTVSMFSSYGDDTIAGVFLAISDDEFQTALIGETTPIHEAYPDRFRRFFIEGGQHTAIGSWATTTKNGTTLKEWTVGMIEGDESAWTDMP